MTGPDDTRPPPDAESRPSGAQPPAKPAARPGRRPTKPRGTSKTVAGTAAANARDHEKDHPGAPPSFAAAALPDLRVVARGVRRRQFDDQLIIQALLLLAEDLAEDPDSGGEKEP